VKSCEYRKELCSFIVLRINDFERQLESIAGSPKEIVENNRLQPNADKVPVTSSTCFGLKSVDTLVFGSKELTIIRCEIAVVHAKNTSRTPIVLADSYLKAGYR